mmetsp:Transcript_6647/g.9650  ORF Transcript_6647/g.9650 Transcript_6647/m.9650 type:complete len:144 (+) Transcript_6647:60-491(+)
MKRSMLPLLHLLAAFYLMILVDVDGIVSPLLANRTFRTHMSPLTVSGGVRCEDCGILLMLTTKAPTTLLTMTRDGDDEKDKSETEDSETDDTQDGFTRPTFFGLEPKQELDSLDNGLPTLGPILLVLQLYFMYYLISEGLNTF